MVENLRPHLGRKPKQGRQAFEGCQAENQVHRPRTSHLQDRSFRGCYESTVLNMVDPGAMIRNIDKKSWNPCVPTEPEINFLGRGQLVTEFFFQLPDGKMWSPKSVNKIFPLQQNAN